MLRTNCCCGDKSHNKIVTLFSKKTTTKIRIKTSSEYTNYVTNFESMKMLHGYFVSILSTRIIALGQVQKKWIVSHKICSLHSKYKNNKHFFLFSIFSFRIHHYIPDTSYSVRFINTHLKMRTTIIVRLEDDDLFTISTSRNTYVIEHLSYIRVCLENDTFVPSSDRRGSHVEYV